MSHVKMIWMKYLCYTMVKLAIAKLLLVLQDLVHVKNPIQNVIQNVTVAVVYVRMTNS